MRLPKRTFHCREWESLDKRPPRLFRGNCLNLVVMRSVLVLTIPCAIIEIASAIVSKNDGVTLTTTPSTDRVDITTVPQNDVQLAPKAQRKGDYLEGAASYEHARIAPYPGDYGGYGGVGYGYGYGGYDPLKGLLVPLAGVALLGAAALFVSNPVLLQLGVIGGKRRRRRAVADGSLPYDKLKEISALETFIEQLPQAQVMKQEKKLVANYLKCSSTLGSMCLERLACEIQKPSSNSTSLERQVLDIVTSEMMKNEYVPKDLKQRIKKAEEVGTENGKCEKYFCSTVDLQ